MKNCLNAFIETIQNAKSIAIAGHKNPDGDSLASVLALARLIELNYNKIPLCLYDGNIPDCLDNIPDRKKIQYFAHVDARQSVDCMILVDYGTEKNLGGVASMVSESKVVYEIDHHKNDSPIGIVCLNDNTAAAVGEILYDLMRQMNWKYDSDVLDLLAVSILTDTGNFKYARSGKSLKVMADLVDMGVCIENISNALNNKSKKTVLMEAAVASQAEFLFDGSLALAVIGKKEYKNLDGRGDTVLNLLGQIKGIEYIVLLKQQKEKQIGVSLRSRTKPIEHIAVALGGGGHMYAAGAVIYDTLDNARSMVLDLFKGEK